MPWTNNGHIWELFQDPVVSPAVPEKMAVDLEPETGYISDTISTISGRSNVLSLGGEYGKYSLPSTPGAGSQASDFFDKSSLSFEIVTQPSTSKKSAASSSRSQHVFVQTSSENFRYLHWILQISDSIS